MDADQYEHVGVASVIDGDTLDIRENRYRFDGVDSPERGARCGDVNVYQSAALALSEAIDTRNVECEPNGKNGDRIVATCFAIQPGGNRENLSEFMVREGWARDWPKYSGGQYASLEKDARVREAGIWGLECPDDLWGDRDYD